jgi:hypothetical protein
MVTLVHNRGNTIGLIEPPVPPNLGLWLTLIISEGRPLRERLKLTDVDTIIDVLVTVTATATPCAE